MTMASSSRVPAGLILETELPTSAGGSKSVLGASAAVVAGYLDSDRGAEYQWNQPLTASTAAAAAGSYEGQPYHWMIPTSSERRIRHQKRGHMFFRICCDMRRAVIIINTVNALLLALLSLGGTMSKEDVLLLTCSGVGILGAVQFSIACTSVAAALYAFFIAHALFIDKDIWRLGTCLLFFYPHAVLIREIQTGIMTRENYHNEEKSCCCMHNNTHELYRDDVIP
jgi:hypothetical protein